MEKSTRILYLKTLYLGLCFCFIFTGFNVCQSYLTTAFDQQFGFLIFMLLYALFCISSFLTPPFTRHILLPLIGGSRASASIEKWQMFVASLFYVLFCLSVAVRVKWVVVVAGCLCGGVGGLMWIGQGSYLTRAIRECRDAEKVLGVATGIFFTFFNLSAVLGNLVALVFLNFGGSGGGFQLLFQIMTGACAFGSLLFLFAPSIPVKVDPSPDPSPAEIIVSSGKDDQKSSKDEKRLSLLQFTKKRTTMLLSPYYLCQGVAYGYTFGNFPLFANFVTQTSVNTKPTEVQIATTLSIAFLLYGISSFLGSLVWGKVYDRFKSLTPLLVSHFILDICAYTLLCTIVTLPTMQKTFVGVYSVGFVLGLRDCLVNAVTNNCNSNMFTTKDEVSLAFSWYRILFGVGIILNALLSSLMPNDIVSANGAGGGGGLVYGWVTMICFNFAVMIISIICGSILQSSTTQSHLTTGNKDTEDNQTINVVKTELS